MSKLTVAVALAIALYPLPAAAHIKCWPRYFLMIYLEQRYQEAPIMSAIDNSGWPVEVWRSKDGKSWSIVTYRPPGQACLLATGVDIIEIEWITPLGEPA